MNDDNIQTSIQDANTANPHETITDTTGTNDGNNHAAVEPDYKAKFGESSGEALRLFHENKAKDVEIARLTQLADRGTSYGNNSDAIIPGFENLGEEEQKNLIEYTNGIRKSVYGEILKDPAIAYAKGQYNENTWDKAFNKIATKYPDLKNDESFKQEYYDPTNVPTNIEEILEKVAKIHLFDKAHELGAKEALQRSSQIDVERGNGGDKTPVSSRTLEDWSRMSQENPAEFAKNAKQFNEDMANGKLK